MIHHIQQSCGLNTTQTPTIIYEDNAACIAQVQIDYVKSQLTKHINPSSSMLMNCKRLTKLKYCKLSHVKILQIYSLSHFQHLVLKGAYVELE